MSMFFTYVNPKKLLWLTLVNLMPVTAFANTHICANVFSNETVFQLPEILLDQGESATEKVSMAKIMKATNSFSQTIFQKLSSLQKDKKQLLGGVVIAPFGGSKVRAFSEIDADSLVIVDWTSIGDFEKIKTDFKEMNNLKKAALNGLLGGMDSLEVKSTSPTSQILLKLYIELGVSKTKLTRYQIEQIPVVRIEFDWKERHREVVFVESQINSDSSGLAPLPTALKRIVSQGAQWVYLSADGVGIFNAKQGGNGLVEASKQLLELNLQKNICGD